MALHLIPMWSQGSWGALGDPVADPDVVSVILGVIPGVPRLIPLWSPGSMGAHGDPRLILVWSQGSQGALSDPVADPAVAPW